MSAGRYQMEFCAFIAKYINGFNHPAEWDHRCHTVVQSFKGGFAQVLNGYYPKYITESPRWTYSMMEL